MFQNDRVVAGKQLPGGYTSNPLNTAFDYISLFIDRLCVGAGGGTRLSNYAVDAMPQITYKYRNRL